MDHIAASVQFPPATSATEEGVVLVGGQLSPNWVISAYCQGIFPWPIVDDTFELLAWFSPDPRAVIELNQLYVSRRLARRIRSGAFRVTCDQDFRGVIKHCAAPRRRETGTWITRGMVQTYCQLHDMGFAHSVEVWQGERLVGGLYGISVGAFFAGESMFFLERDASKVALTYLVAHLQAQRFQLFDIQQATAHSVRMGAEEIPRHEFLLRLRDALRENITFGTALDTSHLSQLITRLS